LGEREFRTELPSTQTEAVRRARDGAAEGSRVVARRQSAGRGRMDHSWASPEGGLYVSLIFRSPRAEATGEASLLPLAVGASLGRAFAERCGVRVALKWPNDLLALTKSGPRKLAGILVDEVDSPSLGRAAVIGVGVNVATPLEKFPREVRARVVTLAELVHPTPSLDSVEELVAGAATSAVRTLASPGGAESVLAEVRAQLHGIGRRATVDGTLTGVITALGDEGELWLRTAEGPVAVRAGDLVVEEA
jgi:BirA family transcriptional regulator, biotin operon repressor / biotin---[acetyl-CoA-carboxylase] ligase